MNVLGQSFQSETAQGGAARHASSLEKDLDSIPPTVFRKAD